MSKWYKIPRAKRVRKIDKSKIIILDTETTGLKETDEVLQLSMVNGNGDVVFSSFFKPKFHLVWPRAQSVNHISPSDVKNEVR